MYKVIISLLAIFCGYVSVSAQRLYLSGTGSDDTRTWDFYCSAGQHSGKWRKIQVPSCWELQGSGDVSFTLDGKEIPYDKSAGCYHCGNVSTWDPEHPNLHTATFTLKSSGHSITRKIGFRTIEFRPHEGQVSLRCYTSYEKMCRQVRITVYLLDQTSCHEGRSCNPCETPASPFTL